MKSRPFVVLRLHHFTSPHQSNRNNDSVRVSRRVVRRPFFQAAKTGLPFALNGCLRENAERLPVDENVSGACERIASARLTMGLNLARSVHDKSCHGVAEMPVLGEVMRGSAGGRDDGDGVNVGEVVGCKNGGARSGYAVGPVNSPPEQRSKGRGQKHPQGGIHGCFGKRLRTWLDGPMLPQRRPRRFEFLRLCSR